MKPARDLHRELSLDSLLERLTPTPGGWVATYRDTTLRSVFQPVLSITHKRVVGYEALLRVVDANGALTSPAALFDRTRAAADVLLLDRLARGLHMANFVAQRIGDGWLFLNVTPRVLDSGLVQREFVDALCRHFGLPPNRIVLEVVEQAARDEDALARTIDMIQHRDFLIAIDDFGTGFSNFDRVWRARPDIVKLDRSLVERANSSADDRRIMHHLVSMLHQAGAMVLAEGVESDDALQTLMEADIDFVQGFWFGQPDASIAQASAAVPALLDAAWRRFIAQRHRPASNEQPGFDAIERLVLTGAATFAASGSLEEAAQRVFTVPAARRVFVTDEIGEQFLPSIGARVDAGQAVGTRLSPLFPETHSNWSRRPYFQRAIAAPGRVALMGPHFSLTEGRDCYTAAVAIRAEGRLVVFCVDFVLDRAGTVMR
ncbi:EAL domain-containing protein [Burkholderia vietnamiensis]|uniref:sensor domain-containing phosphodiesterase n=1 Tax=Burkholderia vietnamiensis TaxID=60552 RepID=UPI00075A0F1B|nr:EAL domain-containing protein [Burkholderia vietnamiensis]KVE04229.1 diguanylate phosphodiesterase [Burkholderia vietnamiensis]MBE0631243.1 EAL domain-containing protein [Burkholderia vietnamiensis]MBR8228029.1 EAL domain-containing protein [Burkholderia vietnamiensis]MDN8036241.1 EAL domain-containing protein [Burkholderia vietnamiensis]